jgi:hypothetical protein
MKQADFDGFTDIIQVVSEQYGKKLSDGAIALYWQGLHDFELSAVREALGRHLRNTDTGQFMPKIADIIRMLHGSTQDSALSAWAKVDKALRSVGLYETVVFDDPLIHVVLHEMGGWVGLGTKTEDEWPFVAKEFENRYRGFKARGEVPQYQPKLIGIVESHNAQQGHAIAQPILIGDAEKAKRVMLGGTDKQLLGITRFSGEETKLHLVERSA